MNGFSFARTPELFFGAQSIHRLGDALSGRDATRILVVFSRSALSEQETREGIVRLLEEAGIRADFVRYDRIPDDADPFQAPGGEYREASPEVVDAITGRFVDDPPDAVVAIGGGSAIDTGKAVSAAISEARINGSASRDGFSIVAYLEGVGSERPSGEKLPFVAVPTTAGTGSEATKNAVLSRIGPHGFKKSLRHERFVPDVAVIDPLLHLTCSRESTAAGGMDAITQLLEAYVSTGSSPLTDALALEGLQVAGRSFVRAVERGASDVDARSGMAYAAYLSGICLANAGLGIVHGLAGTAGALTGVPHGVFCGSLLPLAVERTIDALAGTPDAVTALGKYAAAGRALTGMVGGTLEERITALTGRLREYARVASFPGLESYGVDESPADQIGVRGDNKRNPYAFPADERAALVRGCLRRSSYA
ncbi:MAG: iron-containing alcohol dehydrogenase [Spirochaetota bacterium]